MTGQATALVTGGGRRIGKAIALGLAEAGWRVAVHYRSSRDEAERVVAEITDGGGMACALSCDLRDAASLENLMNQAKDALGPVTCLVNNAARFDYDEVRTMTVAQWDRHAETNLRAPVFLAQAMAAQLPADSHGNIVNIIDERVWKLVPTHFSYTVAKAGLWAATKMLAQSFAPDIRVNAIGPGPTLPNAQQSEQDFARENARMLLGRGTTPDEILAAIKFILASPAMTGQMIALDGGQHLLWQTPDMADMELER